MVNEMRRKGKIASVQRGNRKFEKSLYVTTGENKHGQVDLGPIGLKKKALVHLIFWRFQNDFKQIPEKEHISHVDAEPEVLHLVSESPQMNESRKYCHLFKWYKTLPGEPRPRCPHWECPCTGPE